MKRQVLIQLAALAILAAFVGWWGWGMVERGDVVGLLAPVIFAAIALKLWKPWRTLRER